jgi:hypothetical protein
VDEININGFTVNDAVIYEKTTARRGPGIQWNKTIEVAKGDAVKALHIEKKGDDEYNTYDYWYKIEANNGIHWVFGFYIDFKNRMRMVKKP